MNTDLILPLAADLLLKSSILLVFTWLTLRFWRRAAAAQRAHVWCVAFAAIALLPFTRLAAPHWALSFAPAVASSKSTPAEPVAPAPGAIASAAPVHEEMLLNGATLGVSIWLAGIFLLLAYRLTGTVLLHRCRRSSSSLEDEASTLLTAKIAGDFGITRPVDVRVSRKCHVPVTWGTWRPVVMLPAEALEWPREWLESALRHELGHVKNHDHLKRLGAFLACVFYWPNPLVWAAAKRLHLAQEEASDNLVLRSGVTPQDYATQLLEVIRSTAGSSLLSVQSVAMARPSTLEGRLAAILDDTRNRGSADRLLIFAGMGLACTLGLALGTVQLRAANAAEANLYVTQPGGTTSQPAGNAADAAINAKLQGILLSVNFNNATLEEITGFLAAESKRLDPEHKGIRFNIQPLPRRTQVSIILTNVSCETVLHYACQAAAAQFKVKDGFVVISPIEK